ANRLNRESVAEHRVMTHLVELCVRKPQSWSSPEMYGFAATDLDVEPLVAAFDERTKLIDGKEVPHAITELPGDVACVVGEGVRGVLRLPAAVLVLEDLRQIPMIERGERFDAGRLQFVDQAAVEVDTLRVGLTPAFREDARPRDGEPIRGGADVLKQRDIFLVPVVMVVGDVAVVVVLYVARLVRIRIPDGSTLAVLVPRALDLICRRGGAPVDPLGKGSRVCPLTGRFRLCGRSLGKCWKRSWRCEQRRPAAELGELPTVEQARHDVSSATRISGSVCDARQQPRSTASPRRECSGRAPRDERLSCVRLPNWTEERFAV